MCAHTLVRIGTHPGSMKLMVECMVTRFMAEAVAKVLFLFGSELPGEKGGRRLALHGSGNAPATERVPESPAQGESGHDRVGPERPPSRVGPSLESHSSCPACPFAHARLGRAGGRDSLLWRGASRPARWLSTSTCTSLRSRNNRTELSGVLRSQGTEEFFRGGQGHASLTQKPCSFLNSAPFNSSQSLQARI